MYPDGVCRVTDNYYTKTVQFQDINYQLNQNEDKTAMKQITLGSLGIATLIAAVAVGVFSVILFSGLSYMSKHDLNRLFCYITVGIAALSAGTSLVCAISTNRAVSRRERP